MELATSKALQCIVVEFAGADAHDLIELPDENLAVADLAGVGALRDRLDDAFKLILGDRDLDLDLGQEVDDIFGARDTARYVPSGDRNP